MQRLAPRSSRSSLCKRYDYGRCDRSRCVSRFPEVRSAGQAFKSKDIVLLLDNATTVPGIPGRSLKLIAQTTARGAQEERCMVAAAVTIPGDEQIPVVD